MRKVRQKNHDMWDTGVLMGGEGIQNFRDGASMGGGHIWKTLGGVPLKILEVFFALKVGKLAYIKSKQLSGDGVKVEFRALKKFRENISDILSGEEDLDLKCDICSSLTKPI